jgi:protease I
MANNKSLNGKRIAILVAEGFEEVEMTKPRQALLEAGARVDLVSPENGNVTGFNHLDKANAFKIDVPLDQANAADYDALLLPGGVANPDRLRTLPKAVSFVKAFFDSDKPVAAICHAPWSLVEADVLDGRTLTSWPSLKTDITNAGGTWVDREVVVDGNLVTSRKPDDIPAFNDKMLELFARTPATASSKN